MSEHLAAPSPVPASRSGARSLVRGRGLPPGRLAVAWNLLSVAMQTAWSSSAEENHLQSALGALPASCGPAERRALGRAMRRRRLEPAAAAGLAALASREAAAPDVDTLRQAWRMLSGGVVLSRYPQALLPAYELAVLAAGVTGRQVLVVAGDATAAGQQGRRLMPSAEALGLSLAVIPEGATRGERRGHYGASIVCVALGQLTLDLLHELPSGRRRAAGLRHRIDRLAGSGQVPMLPDRPSLALFRDVGELLCERALDSNALLGDQACSDERSLADTALELASLLRPEDHFAFPEALSPARLTEAGRQTLESLALSRSGLMGDRTLREAAVSRALLVRYGLESGRHFLVEEGRIRACDPHVADLMEDRQTLPALAILIEQQVGIVDGRPRGLRAQARSQQLLAGGLARIGGCGLHLPGLTHELSRLHDLPVWVSPIAPEASRHPFLLELYEAPDLSAALGLVAGNDLPCQDALGLVLPEATDRGALPGVPVVTLPALLSACRQEQRLPMLEGVSHLVLVIGEDLDPHESARLASARLPALVHVSVIILREGAAATRRLSDDGLTHLRLAARRHRLVRHRTKLKRRLLQRDDNLQRLMQFSGESGR